MYPRIRIRIHTKMSWIRNTALNCRYTITPLSPIVREGYAKSNTVVATPLVRSTVPTVIKSRVNYVTSVAKSYPRENYIISKSKTE
jgi:hypothetical protein